MFVRRSGGKRLRSLMLAGRYDASKDSSSVAVRQDRHDFPDERPREPRARMRPGSGEVQVRASAAVWGETADWVRTGSSENALPGGGEVRESGPGRLALGHDGFARFWE